MGRRSDEIRVSRRDVVRTVDRYVGRWGLSGHGARSLAASRLIERGAEVYEGVVDPHSAAAEGVRVAAPFSPSSRPGSGDTASGEAEMRRRLDELDPSHSGGAG